MHQLAFVRGHRFLLHFFLGEGAFVHRPVGPKRRRRVAVWLHQMAFISLITAIIS